MRFTVVFMLMSLTIVTAASGQECGLSVSVEGRTVTATVSGGDCGDPVIMMFRDDRPFIVNTRCPGQPTCTASYELPACDQPRTYAIDVIGQCGRMELNRSGEMVCNGKESVTTVSLTLAPIPPEVDVAHIAAENGQGKLAVSYAFHEPPSGDINLYRGESTTPFASGNAGVALGQAGVWEVPLDTSCWPSGLHRIRAEAATCGRFGDERYMGEGGTAITIDNEPSVSLSAGQAANGEVSFTTNYQFRNTSSGGLQLWVDGALTDTKTDLTGAGNWVTTLPLACWRDAKVIASACDATAEDEIKNEEGEPSVGLFLRKAVNPTNGRFEAVVVYDLREPIADRYVRVERLSWIDGDGTEHPDGTELGFRDADDPLSDGEWVIPFDPPSGARHVIVRVTAQSCGRKAKNAGIDCGCDATLDPVYFADGNMRLTDTDPLPPISGHTLTRTYDSDEQVGGLFGRGFTTLFEQRLMRHAVDGGEVVSIVSPSNDVVVFDDENGSFSQTWPTSQGAVGTLSFDAATQTYVHRTEHRSELAIFRAGDGKLAALRNLATGREARITYDANGLPQTLSDSWTGVTWTLTIQGRRVVSIAISGRPDLTWQYQYDSAGNLITVLAPGGAAWRTYQYSANRMIASYDALGNLIESHNFDANGYATDSTGPGDEIQSIAYNLTGITADERVTKVTMKTGAVTEYVLRPSGGGYRVVQVKGACASCGGGAGDRTYVRDAEGRIVREQHPDGFISVTTYAGHLPVAEERHLKPADCDPQTAADRCRMTTDGLAAAILAATSATVRTEYSYADTNWPDRATTISTPSISAPGRSRREDVSYHARSGAVTARISTGFTGAEGAPMQRGAITTFYEQSSGGDDEGGSPNWLAPAFDPGGPFQTAWMSLPQPELLTKSVDGPRSDADDITAFVHYPVEESVPALLRGQLAAVRNAAGHITRYESYDEFGNVTRLVDPNGVITETTYDILGRLTTSTVKAVPGCEPSRDAFCNHDLTITRTYSPAAGPLESERQPSGGTTAYSYDARGRIRTMSRGPSATDLRERIETEYDSQTGRKSVERILAGEDGTWVEKRKESFAYNTLGELTAVIHADDTRITYTYDAAGRVASIRDEKHVGSEANTTYTYDPAGRVHEMRQKLARSEGGSISTRYAHDFLGNLVAVTDPNGNVTTYTYDDFGQMVRQQSPVTGATLYDYDAAGNLKRVLDANGIATERSYDALGRIVSATSLVPATTPPGEDDDGRGDPPPSPPATTTTRTEIVNWIYDDLTPGRFGIGRVASMADPAGTTVYEYERRGLLTQEKRTFSGCFVTRESGANCDEFFASRTFITGYRYDRDGNRSSIDYPSNKLKVNYTYDFAGRPVGASGAVTSAEYLPFGPLRRLTFANGTTQTFSYDARYRVTQNALTVAQTTLADYRYGYDPVGNITSIDDALEPVYSRTFAYDDLNRLVTANTGTALWRDGSYTWDAMGNPTTIKIGEIMPGDGDGMLRSGRPIRADTEWRPGGRTLVFTYQGTTPHIDRVTTNASPSNGDDNLLRTGSGIRSQETTAGVPVTYDAAGNEVGYLVTRTYSTRNLLSEVVRRSDEEGFVLEHKLMYSYDGRGVRVVRGEKPSDGVAAVARRYYLYAPELKLLSVTLDDAPNIWAAAAEKDMKYEIIWFGNRPVAQVELTGGRSYTFADHLGTPIIQTNENGTMIWRAEYEPFGNIYQMRTDANGDDIGRRGDQPLRFPGQEAAMGWEGQEENYNVFRWYRAGWGRYTQADPIGFRGGVNLYAYVHANPLTRSDRFGLRDFNMFEMPPNIPRMPPGRVPNPECCSKRALQREIDNVNYQIDRMMNGQTPEGTIVAMTFIAYWCHQGVCTPAASDPSTFEWGNYRDDKCANYCINFHEWVHFNDLRSWDENWSDTQKTLFHEFPAYVYEKACLLVMQERAGHP